jgi:WD40 repeat protein
MDVVGVKVGPAKPGASAATARLVAPQKSWSFWFWSLRRSSAFCDNVNTATMFENLCAIPLESDLFAQAIHPSEPIVAVGLASGHVQAYRLPAGASDDSDPDETLASESGFGHIETAWSTRRHKGSCRTLAYSVDGSSLYSAGTDGIVKVADCATGRVTAKIAVPYDA